MSHKEKWKWAYKVVRSLLFTAVAFVAFLYITLYILLSLPGVQDKVRREAETELSKLFTSRLTIDNVDIYPFNEIVVEGVTLYEPAAGGGEAPACARIERLGAGISIWNLIAHKKIIITYVELVGLDARLSQREKDGRLNIDFLIEAFKPKDKNKPPTRFDLRIRNIVIRKSKARFSRPWLGKEGAPAWLSELRVEGLNADVALPRLSNDLIEIDLRRLEFSLKDMLKVERLKGYATIDHGNLSIAGFELETERSSLTIADITLPLAAEGGLKKWLASGDIKLGVEAAKINPAEFAPFWAPLASLDRRMKLSVAASGNMGRLTLHRLSVATVSDTGRADGAFSLQIDDAEVAAAGNEQGRRLNLPIGEIIIPKLTLKSTPAFNSDLARLVSAGGASADKVAGAISAAGELDLRLKGNYSESKRMAAVDLDFQSGVGNMTLVGLCNSGGNTDLFSLDLHSDGIDFGRLLSTDALGRVVIDLEARASTAQTLLSNIKGLTLERLDKMVGEADLSLDLPMAEIKGYSLGATQLNLHKSGSRILADMSCDDPNFDFDIAGSLDIAGADSRLALDGDVRSVRPGALAPLGAKVDFTASGEISARLIGSSPDNLQGDIDISRVRLDDHTLGRTLDLDSFRVNAFIADNESGGGRKYEIVSDWIEGGINGHFTPTRLPMIVGGLLSDAFPSLLNAPKDWRENIYSDHLDFDFTLLRESGWSDFFRLPVKLLYEANVSGELDAASGILSLSVDAPYIQQGRDKLIRQTTLDAGISNRKARLNLNTVYPTKKGDLHLLADMMSTTGNIDMSLIFNPDRTTGFFGNIAMQLGITDSYYPAGKALSLHILPSKLSLNGSEWNVAEANIDYFKNEAGGIATINGFRISHDRQFVDITGIASASTDDEVVVTLREIDLDYIFDTLNINYVSFGGRATGEAVGTALLSPDPQASTTRLHVDNFSYNHSVLGDAELHGDFDMAQKRVGISADVAEAGRRVAKIDGGIWIGRDSLSFAMDADKVRIGFLQPFMSAFSSKVDGRASGKAHLYGTFSDIDMAGRMMADTIALKVDYTNVTYTGRDSVIITPGRIHIPSFTLHDEYGNSARLSGELTHRYFHDPEFDFRISDARNLLVYDTNAQINPIWYGRIFGSGGGRILGRGNYVGVTADMTTQANSVFTFVLSDQEEAADYRFLTFTDRRLEELEAKGEITLSESDEIVRAFKKKVEEQMGPESVFGMDIRATLTPATRLVLVMDPAAGDKITAHGSGAMNLTYRSDSDEMRMYGKYVLDEGTYNFSLQDVILKDFIIKRGSSISFNGDPMDGLLDIRAAYRVNTNLTDLDATFATDRDLNRTNVPVDAMLIVTGQMEHPEISFDIELPTLNDEVEQKVRSVIASEDMMNLQMIYLLALNRFYTPEYMGGTSGGEWASVASSTLSSQLANILGQLTDKVTVAPSFRSDKGDFSDLEVDLALSSRLFNNRLLINGNIGYRDPSTSNTTFVGDFDVEYLLNRGGNWRLKAYNHFNDQNYYLKSALTTQGVGIMWRREFNHIFGHGKRRPSGDTPEAPRDSVE